MFYVSAIRLQCCQLTAKQTLNPDFIDLLFVLQLYMVPQMAFFGDIHTDPWNNYRVYGTAFMIVLTLTVAIGVKFIALFAPISLACVIVSILSIVVGAILANPESKNIWFADYL